MSGEGSAKLFNELAFHVLSYIEVMPGVTELDFEERHGVSSADIGAWDAANMPYRLPAELAAFLCMFDGLRFSWRVTMPQRGSVLVGSMRLNRLRDVARTPIDCPNSVFLSGERERGGSSGATFAAFVLEHHPRVGKVALVYRNEHETSDDAERAAPGSGPQVWLQDLGCRWHFLAENFSAYFRLMVVHLGIQGWQYAYTDVGLDEVTQQWMRLYCPQRLAMDLALDLSRPTPPPPPTSWRNAADVTSARALLNERHASSHPPLPLHSRKVGGNSSPRPSSSTRNSTKTPAMARPSPRSQGKG